MNEDFMEGTCHLHGDANCGKNTKLGSDLKVYPGRLRCSNCKTVFCRNGLQRKFGVHVEGAQVAEWVCMVCTEECCCRLRTACLQAQQYPNFRHTHCHNFRCATTQRRKRKLAKSESNKRSTGNVLNNDIQLRSFKSLMLPKMDPMVREPENTFLKLYSTVEQQRQSRTTPPMSQQVNEVEVKRFFKDHCVVQIGSQLSQCTDKPLHAVQSGAMDTMKLQTNPSSSPLETKANTRTLRLADILSYSE